MILIKNIDWPTVWQSWVASEVNNPGWIKTATEVKGWPTWEAWRGFTVQQLRLDQRQWKLMQVEQPFLEVPKFLVGPFSGWQQRLPKPNAHSFADLTNIPEQYEEFTQHTKIGELQKHFPASTMFTGLFKPSGEVVLIEGHHRALAIALAAHDGQEFPIANLTIAIAELGTDESTLLDEVLKRGSTKEPPSEN